MRDGDFQFRQLHHACELAQRGLGHVEPNPMVGCVITVDDHIVASGWHTRYGAPHAETEAIQQLAGLDLDSRHRATLYVTLEPCCHHGKTPPCTDAILQANIKRVIVGTLDPHPRMTGQGIATLQRSGVQVEVVNHAESVQLTRPFAKRWTIGKPWVIAKWAMTCDGRIATPSGASRWITSESARQRAHQLRGRMDAVLVGIGTALADDPLLTPRDAAPPRQPLRIVLDTRGRLPLTSRLVQTAAEFPLLLVTGPDVPMDRLSAFRDAGLEVYVCTQPTRTACVDQWLRELHRRELTNILVEGGGQVLGNLFEASEIDEVHVFIAPKIVGGGPAPLAACGVMSMEQAWQLDLPEVEVINRDIYLRGRVKR